MFFEDCDILNPVSAVLKLFGFFIMVIKNASTASSKSNQLRNVNNARWESRNVTTQPLEINNRKSEVIAFIVNAGMNVTANNFLQENF